MAKYRKKPVVVNAWQWTGKCWSEAHEFIESNNLPFPLMLGARNGVAGLIIQTLEGDMVAQTDDYIIEGVKGEFYPCKPDIFEATYEKVEEQ